MKRKKPDANADAEIAVNADTIEQQLREHLAKPVPEAARLRRIGALIQKRNSGKRLSKTEVLELEEFAGTPLVVVEANDERARPPEPKWVGSRERLGDLLGVHPNTFPQWLKEHPCPKGIELKRANGDWYVPGWRAYMAHHGLSGSKEAQAQAQSQAAQGTPATVARKFELEIERLQEQVRELKRTNDAEERKFLVKAEVEEWVAKRASWIRGRLLKLKREMPPRFAGLDQMEFAVRLGPLVDSLIEEFTEAKPDKADTDFTD